MGQVQNAHAKETPFLGCNIDDPGTQIVDVAGTAGLMRVDHLAGLSGDSCRWRVNIEVRAWQSSDRVCVTDRVRD